MPQGKSLKRLSGAEADGSNGDGRPKRRRKTKGVNGSQDPAHAGKAMSEDDGDLSDPEEVNAFRDMGCIVKPDIDDAGGDGWRRGLEELRKRHKRQARSEQPRAVAGQPPPQERLLALARSAAESGKWEAVTAPALMPRQHDIAAVVRKLDPEELTEVLKACAQRHEANPRERAVCCAWIIQALEDGGEDVIRRKVVRKKLRPLLAALAQRVGPASRSGEVFSCVGKWRYVAELAAVRRETLKVTGADASQPAAAAAAKKAPPQGGEDDDEDSDDDVDEDANGEAELDDDDE